MSVPTKHTMKGGAKRKTLRRRLGKKTLRKKNYRKKRVTHRKKNKGGFVGTILEQAIVPFGLFALQKKMQNRKKSVKVGKRKSKK